MHDIATLAPIVIRVHIPNIAKRWAMSTERRVAR